MPSKYFILGIVIAIVVSVVAVFVMSSLGVDRNIATAVAAALGATTAQCALKTLQRNKVN